MLDTIMKAFKPKQVVGLPTPSQEELEADTAVLAVSEGTHEASVEVIPEEPNPQDIQDMKDSLTLYVYDAELAEELAPIFVNMKRVNGFDKVLELFAAKEKQIEALNVGVSLQQSTATHKTDKTMSKLEEKTPNAADIIRQRKKQA